MRLPTFQKHAKSYDDAFIDKMASEYLDRSAWTRLRLDAVHNLVEPAPRDRVLDLGCAAGAITDFLSGLGCRVTGVDAEQRAIERARSLFPEWEFLVANVANLPLIDDSFDKAVAADLVEHLDGDTFYRMLGECRRVLVPGGTLSIYTPNPQHLIERLKKRELLLAQNVTHIGLRTAPELRAALEASGFRVDIDAWRPSFIPVFRQVERIGGRLTPFFRYRLCIRARTPGRFA